MTETRRPRLPDPPILVITDRSQCAEPLEARARSLFRGGCRWLSLREGDMDSQARLALLARLAATAREFGATISVHGDTEAAKACKTALHMPSSGNVARARLEIGPTALIGQSCHGGDELGAAAAGGADYATLGPVVPSASKPGYTPTYPVEILSGMAHAASIPVLALGGITESTLSSLSGSGFAGAAIMGEAMRAADPEAWFMRIRALWRSIGG